MSFNDTHPELKEGEVFLTNLEIQHIDRIGYKSKRVGYNAYNINGKLVDNSYINYNQRLVPVFVNKKEYDDHMERMKPFKIL